jgi:hypothetical protein
VGTREVVDGLWPFAADDPETPDTGGTIPAAESAAAASAAAAAAVGSTVTAVSAGANSEGPGRRRRRRVSLRFAAGDGDGALRPNPEAPAVYPQALTPNLK